MPNHVTNRIKLEGDRVQVRDMLEKIQNDAYGLGTIDFNKILPMPESLNIECGSRTDHGLEAYKKFARRNISEERYLARHPEIKPDEWELGKKAFANIRDHGAPTWFEWCSGHWGTKWNAYGFENGVDYSKSNKPTFYTAWNAPHPVIAKLAEMFPEIEVTHEWADEDIGVNCGRYVYSDGERIEEYFPEGKVESVEFATEIIGVSIEEYGLTLNASGTDYISLEDDTDYEYVEVYGRPALFTEARVTDADIPKGLFCCHLRSTEGFGEPSTIEKNVKVNFGGSLITTEEIDLGEQGYIELNGQVAPGFLDERLTMKQFLDEKYENSEVMTLE